MCIFHESKSQEPTLLLKISADWIRFMVDLMNFPDQIRNITLAGHLHHGKTAFMDMLVFETHDLPPQAFPKKGAQVGFYRMF